MVTTFFPDILDTVQLSAYGKTDLVPNLFYTFTAEQTHSASVAWLDKPGSQCALTADGMWTPCTGIPLIVRTADCLPILCYSTAGVIGAIHAGRRGTQAGILRNALELLFEKVGRDHKLYVFFGPAICAECYQIDKVTDQHFDLIAQNVKQVQSICEPTRIPHWIHFKIDRYERCTKENPIWNSYRRAKENHEEVKMNYFSIEQKAPWFGKYDLRTE